MDDCMQAMQHNHTTLQGLQGRPHADHCASCRWKAPSRPCDGAGPAACAGDVRRRSRRAAHRRPGAEPATRTGGHA